MPLETIEEKSKYNKRIEEIMEDAEIEAELEAEKKIRSKNTKMLLITLVGVSLVMALYFGIKSVSTATSKNESAEQAKTSVPGSPELQPVPILPKNKNAPLPPIRNGNKPPASNDKAVPPKSPVRKSASSILSQNPVKRNSKESLSRNPILSTPQPAKRAPTKPPRQVLPPTTPIKKSGPPILNSSGKYVIQLGAFNNKENAQKLYNRVKASGFPVKLATRSRGGNSSRTYLVQVGNFATKENASETQRSLSKKGFYNSFVKKTG